MIINDDFVFIHNPISGGGFVRDLIKGSHPDSEFSEVKHWHLPIKSLDDKHRHKFKFGMVRNPWSWYFSLYQKSQKQGGIYAHLIGFKYELSFKQWVMKLLSSETAEKLKDDGTHMIGNPWTEHDIYHFKYMLDHDIGLYTYQYVYLFFNRWREMFSGEAPLDHDLISIDEVVKLEGAGENLVKSFADNQLTLSAEQKNRWKTHGRANTNPNIDGRSYVEHYDDELIEIVRDKDRFIVDNNDYSFKG